MAEDVIDIRKRIEEIRNEVSTAMTDGGETIICLLYTSPSPRD